ncbi:MAG: hypothetical protein AVO35_11775 [Candidatus Aegiribacteria sp. MLS_C]|nr:MAG: hypothetical protein AVO35_11775 [Candidatus Aegiribacteria sp. MLS_C]
MTYLKRAAGIALMLSIFAMTACTAATSTVGGGALQAGAVQEIPATAAGETEVLAEGVASVSGSAVDMARDSALDDALRKAVEQGVGAFIDSETRVSSFQLISDEIYSRTSGYVSSYRIIEEGVYGDLYRVVLRAVVKTDRIQDDLAAIGLLLRQQGRPRVMAVIREYSAPSASESDSGGSDLFETAVLEHFRNRGFPVVDAAAVRELMDDDRTRLLLAGDEETAVLLGLETGAEIVVSGTVDHSRISRDIGGTRREVHEYSVSARAINTRTGSMLAGASLTVALPFSRAEARSRAADSTAARLESAILEGWTESVNTTVIVASGADFQKVQELRTEIMEGVRGVTDVVIRELTGSMATLEVVSETSGIEVMDDLYGLGTGFVITRMGSNRIDIEFVD